MNISETDKEEIKKIKRWRFRDLVLDYIEESQEAMKTGIISWVSEDMSKTKRNDRDIELVKLQMLDEFKNIPDRLLTLIENGYWEDQN